MNDERCAPTGDGADPTYSVRAEISGEMGGLDTESDVAAELFYLES